MTADRAWSVCRGVARGAVLVTMLGATMVPAVAAQHDHHDHEQAPVVWSCAVLATPAAAASHDHGMTMDVSMATPVAAAEIGFDQLYIDMMIPHHASIVALAQAALPQLTDLRLKEMARDIIRTQTTENQQLASWRTAWFGSGEPLMDEQSMNQMLVAMPVGSMDEMMREMDARTQVSTFCAASDPDLAFIEQAIPHHEILVAASRIALDAADHPELVAFAESVIANQEAEIETLNAILAELQGGATPAA